VAGGRAGEDSLFLTETYQPFTKNALTLLFARLKGRAGLTETPMSPTVLRDTFAVRVLEAGGTLEELGAQLGLKNLEALKRYECAARPSSEDERQQEQVSGQEPPSRPGLRRSLLCRGRASSAAKSTWQRRGAGKWDDTARKGPVSRTGEDPEEVLPADGSDLATEGAPEQETEKISAGVQAHTLPTAPQACREHAREPSALPHLKTEEETAALFGKVSEPAVSSALPAPVVPCQRNAEARPWQLQSTKEEDATCRQETATGAGAQRPKQEPRKGGQTSEASAIRPGLRQRRSALSIERAIQEFLEEVRRRKRQPKTLQWHQTALALFQQYLQQECQCVFVDQITPSQVQSWFTSVQETPTTRETKRAAGTVESYARSARAFCRWLVSRRLLKRTPFAGLLMPIAESSLPHLLEPQEWEGLLQACRSPREKMSGAEQATARNQALLWVLAEAGIRACEVCGLRLGDVDREQGLLRVRGKGSRARWVPLKQEGLRQLLVYIDHHRLETVKREQRKRVGEGPLFVSETGRPLTENGIALLFGRLRKRAGITRKDVNPTLLRDSFAVRYLQAGGDLFTLRELLGQEESAVVKRSLQIHEKVFGERKE
jgi:integrase/recombinase XerD